MIKEDDNKKIAFISNQDYSSIVNQFIKTISNQFVFLFFLRKDFKSTKSTKTQTVFDPVFRARKKLLLLLLFVRLLLICQLVFACAVFLYAQKFFVKKKKSGLKLS